MTQAQPEVANDDDYGDEEASIRVFDKILALPDAQLTKASRRANERICSHQSGHNTPWLANGLDLGVLHLYEWCLSIL